ncbi:hypothetical protein EV1_015932 [Malus domestica]
MSTSVKIESLLGMLTIKLNDENFIKWSFQFCSVLRGYDLLDHFTGESVCPPKFVLIPDLGVTNEISITYKEWVKKDMALLSLLIATLSDDAIEHVVGCKTSYEAWTALQDRYMSVSKASVNHLKAELHTMQKGGDSIDKYLLRLKGIKDQLQAAGEKVCDNDLIIAALTGLPPDYDISRMVMVLLLEMVFHPILIMVVIKGRDILVLALTHTGLKEMGVISRGSMDLTEVILGNPGQETLRIDLMRFQSVKFAPEKVMLRLHVCT